VNSIPGWRGLSKTVPFNIADIIVEHILCVLDNQRVKR
jgi:hypothetical protein